MNSSESLARSGYGRQAGLKTCLTALAALGGTGALQAQGIMAKATLEGISNGRGLYNYTLTLENTSASTSDIGLFWFAWEAGQADFLASSPTSIQTPPGWNAVVEGGGDGDGYSVQFVTFTSPLTPGSAVTFTFNSVDSPKTMSGPAPFYPQYPTLTSQVYSDHAADGREQIFVTQLVLNDLGKINTHRNGKNLTLSWTSWTNSVLQASPSATGTNWMTVPGTVGAGSYVITNFSQNANFYRVATQ